MIHRSIAMLGLIAGMLSVTALAADKPASPRSLPTDELPPFGMLDDAGKLIPLPTLPPPPAPTGAAAESPTPTQAGISMDVAIAGARAALNACTAQNVRIAVAVVDARGKPRALLMQEGSEGSVFVAMRKAQAALAFGSPSSQVGAKLKQDPALLSKITPAMFVAGGALPIFNNNVLLGAIASSGAHGGGPVGSQDENCAQAGLRSITGRLAPAHK